MAYKKQKRFFTYKCSITEEQFTTTEEAPNPDDLISVKAYYEMDSSRDDRPENIKKQLANQAGE
jgi:hypothetical protein